MRQKDKYFALFIIIRAFVRKLPRFNGGSGRSADCVAAAAPGRLQSEGVGEVIGMAGSALQCAGGTQSPVFDRRLDSAAKPQQFVLDDLFHDDVRQGLFPVAAAGLHLL